jgi:hypothetical protein
MCAKKIPAIHTSERAPARVPLGLPLNFGCERYHWYRFHTIENDNQIRRQTIRPSSAHDIDSRLRETGSNAIVLGRLGTKGGSAELGT